MTDDPNKKGQQDPHQQQHQRDQGNQGSDVPRKGPTHNNPDDVDENDQEKQDQRRRQAS